MAEYDWKHPTYTVPKVNPPNLPQRQVQQREVQLVETDKYTFKFSEVKRGKSTVTFKPETREEFKKRAVALYKSDKPYDIVDFLTLQYQN